MYIQDLRARSIVEREDELMQRLRSVRKGDFGAFILWHKDGGPSLWIHTNKDLAYLHFFPDKSSDHPGLQPTGMSPMHCDASVKFLQTSGAEADSITVPQDKLVSVDLAYRAAIEFLHKPGASTSVSWFSL